MRTPLSTILARAGVAPQLAQRNMRHADVDKDQLLSGDRKSLPMANPSDNPRIDATICGNHAGVTQLVECQPSKLNVEGSSPFARFRKRLKKIDLNLYTTNLPGRQIDLCSAESNGNVVQRRVVAGASPLCRHSRSAMANSCGSVGVTTTSLALPLWPHEIRQTTVSTNIGVAAPIERQSGERPQGDPFNSPITNSPQDRIA